MEEDPAAVACKELLSRLDEEEEVNYEKSDFIMLCRFAPCKPEGLTP